MSDDSISILDGSTFVVSNGRGDLDAMPDQPHGFFFRDTRFLSQWRLSVRDQSLAVLSTDTGDYFSSQFFLYLFTDSIRESSSVSLIRHRFVGDGFHEDVIVLNHGEESLELEIEIKAEADFADLFEVKDALKKNGKKYSEIRGNELVLGYRRQDFVRETHITSTEPAKLKKDGLTFRVRVEPQGRWETCIDVVPIGDFEVRHKHGHGSFSKAEPNMRMGLEEWIAAAPKVSSSWDKLGHIYWRSLVDLAALRFYPDSTSGASLPAAGLPWFMALFGRDSILTSYQALPFIPELAETTLRTLAGLQGTKEDDFRDEEPGKILHEKRLGELTVFDERPHSPYYGASDTTPLWLILLDETLRWTGNAQLAHDLEPNARAALEWIDRFGDSDGDGYVEYQPKRKTGLENQCWKDSSNSILFADGTLARLPRATCEIQGYVYDAKVRTARLAREFWNDTELAGRLEHEAKELKERFNNDFWMAERECFAVALDGKKRQVDSITSNIGHLLWSGVVDADKADHIARHLTSDKLYSGWGIRTMAEGEAGYNPIEYHNGTVWPHDTSLIAAGLRRYGYVEDAARLCFAVLEAATYFDWRLPEAFAGYGRQATGVPVRYPTASSPQAWASGAPLLMLRVLLGLEPDGSTDPVLPKEIEKLTIENVRIASGKRRRSRSCSPRLLLPVSLPALS